MKKIDIVFNYINNKISAEQLLNCIKNNSSLGVDAAEIQENLGIIRNNASTILNTLWKSSHLIKINSRPVTFIPRAAVESLSLPEHYKLKNIYTLEELREVVDFAQTAGKKVDPFQHLPGNNSSLASQIGQAKAAIIYPPKGLHSLILGEGGAGKTTFAAAMYEYGLISRGLAEDSFPFVAFNCADYFTNPQLLLSQLFGHAKGAFTGAESEKIGLVEKANGGILFLDEIHRLPPDGQEMLFYLMDKGEYHRLGETGNKRKSNVLIIAATTEDPNGVLLSTFLRRIPVIITLPPLREKVVSERIEIIENFFYTEAVNLNKRIIVSPEVLKALAIYEFRAGNIGQLRSEIKLLCAKSFLQHLQNNQDIIIDFRMLAKELREYVFNYAQIDNHVKTYLDMFSENLIFHPVEDKSFYPYKLNNDIYDMIIKKLDKLKLQGLSKETIDQEIGAEIENYFAGIMKNFNSHRLNMQQLYKLIPQAIVDASAALINTAQQELSTKFNNKFIYGLAFHVQALLKRISEEKPIQNPNMAKIKREYPAEFNAAKKLVKQLSEKFGVIIPEDEKGFLALLLANNKLSKKSEDKIGIMVVCHGDSTASSMKNVANTLLNSDLVKAIDMPLDAEITDTYNKVRAAAIAINRGKGILMLVDMGSLLNFTEKLKDETGIAIKTIENVSTPLVLEALRSVLYKNDDLETVYHSLIHRDYKQPVQTPVPNKKKAILTVCVTGQGSSMMAKNILSGILTGEYKEQLEIIATRYIDSSKSMQDISNQYDVVAVVGSIKPEINKPYFPISKLLDEHFQKEFLQFLDNNINNKSAPEKSNKSVYEISKEMLEQYVRYINPKLAVANIKKFIRNINYINERDEELIDLIVHMGCMLDRCVHKDEIIFEDMEAFKEKHLQQFLQVRKAADILGQDYDIRINDAEVCYIIKIINR